MSVEDLGPGPTVLGTPMNEMQVAVGINELKRHVHACAVDHGWWDIDGGKRNMGEMIALMHSELSEALESYRDSEPYLWYRHEDEAAVPVAKNGWSSHPYDDSGAAGKPEGVAAEFADVIIRILDTCEREGIPITQALIHKHNYNLSRPYRHGGKAC